MNVQASLWRSIAVFRVASPAYAAVLIVVDRRPLRCACGEPGVRVLQLHNRGELIRYAIEHGLDSPPGPDSRPG